MIFIDREQTTLMIPKHVIIDEPLKLTLRHNLTDTIYEFNNLTNTDTSTLYWIFVGLDFTSLQTGEYNYDLNGLETGLLSVNTTETTPISYTTEKTIVQYGN